MVYIVEYNNGNVARYGVMGNESEYIRETCSLVKKTRHLPDDDIPQGEEQQQQQYDNDTSYKTYS